MKRSSIYKITLFLLIVISLLFPFLQSQFEWLTFRKLKGSFDKHNYETLSVNNWFNGSYQKKSDAFLSDSFSLRPGMVRLYNQFYFTFFKSSKTKAVIVGKENYLYEENYINTIYGRDFLGKEVIDEKIRKLEAIRDTLSAFNTDLLIVLAAGKGSYYPEFIPNNLKGEETELTNYKYYSSALKNTSLNLIDFNAYFMSQKDISEHKLYPKTGIHWSNYGQVIALDSMIHFMEKLKGINMVDIDIKEISKSKIALKRDSDIEDAMNLLYNIEDLEMSYPKFSYKNDSSSIKPKVIYVADSYYWGMFNMGASKKMFTEGKFWYYFKQVYPDTYKSPLKVKDFDVKSQVEEYDVVVLMATNATLYKFPFGFIDRLYGEYFPEKESEKD